jgi:hypothetical protein
MNEQLSGPELDDALNDIDFSFSDYYVFRSLLGKGGFGLVVEAIRKTTLEVMAVKVVGGAKWAR